MRVALIVGVLAVMGSYAVSGFAQSQTLTTAPKVGLPKGSFVAAGGGTPADVVARFIALAGGPAAPIVAIPPSPICILEPGGAPRYGDACAALTLSGRRVAEPRRPQTLADGTASFFRSAGATNVTVLETYERTVADSDTFVAPLRAASGVWIMGGTPQKLMEVYAATKMERELRNLLARGGVFGGTSAGAVLIGSHYTLDFAGTAGYPVFPGFGFLRNVGVFPHARELTHFARDAAKYPERITLAMDERTAWEVHGDIAEVIGVGSAFVLGDDPTAPARGYLTLRAGDRYDLATRQVTRATR
jgi:cyanophycinase-like exopeptidase